MMDVALIDNGPTITLRWGASDTAERTERWPATGVLPRALLHELSELETNHGEVRVWPAGEPRQWERLATATGGLFPHAKRSCLRSRSPVIPTGGTLRPSGPLRVLILAHPLVPEGERIAGIDEAVTGLCAALEPLTQQGQAVVLTRWLDTWRLTDVLKENQGLKVDLLIYVGHGRVNDANVEVTTSQTFPRYLTTSELLVQLAEVTGSPVGSVFWAGCNTASAHADASTPAAAGLRMEIGGACYAALCREFGAALAHGAGFGRACQDAWAAAARLGWNGSVITGLSVADDTLVPTTSEAATNAYLEQVQHAFGTSDGPGGRVRLDDVYEELPLLVPKPKDAYEQRYGNDFEAGAPHAGWRRFKASETNGDATERVTLRQSIREGPSVLVVADPGAGKTTLLRATCRELAQAGQDLPLYVHLGRWPVGHDLVGAACASIDVPTERPWHSTWMPALRQAFERAKQSSGVTLLIDGIDEVEPGRMAQLSATIAAFCSGATALHLVLAMRPSGDPTPIWNALSPALHAERSYLAVFETAQLEDVSERWLRAFGSAVRGAELVAQARRGAESWQLAHSPLLLRGMCLLLARGQLHLPSTLSALIAELVHEMMRRGIDQLTSTRTDAHSSAPNPVLIEQAMQTLLGACAGQLAEQATGELELSFANYPAGFDKLAHVSGSPVGTLLEWARHSGLLAPLGRDRWCFVHRVFEEYFTGWWLVNTQQRSQFGLLGWIAKYAIDPERQWCRRELFEGLRWMGPFMSSESMQLVVDWLLTNDSVLFDGAILAARMLAEASEAVFLAHHARVDARLAVLFEHPAAMVMLGRWQDGLVAYVAGWNGTSPTKTRRPWQRVVCNDNVFSLAQLGDGATLASFLLNRTDLTDLSWHRTMRAIGALRNVRTKQHIDAILPFLTDPCARRRISAIKALETLDAKNHVQELLPLLADNDDNVREAAIDALAQLGAKEHAVTILPLITNGNIRLSASAFMALKKLGTKEHAVTILPLLANDNVAVRVWAIATLKNLGAKEYAEAMIPLLADGDGAVRSSAVDALGRLRAIEVIPSILPLLRHNCGWVRDSAIEALKSLDAKEYAVALLPLLADTHCVVRTSAIGAIKSLGAKEYAVALLPLLTDDEAEVRESAIDALEQLGAKELSVNLIPSLSDNDVDVRESAISALVNLDAKQLAVNILPLLADDNERVRESAFDAVGQLGTKALAANILPFLAHNDEDVRGSAISALVALDAKELAVHILPLLAHNDEDVRGSAISALVALDAKELAVHILPLLADDDLRSPAIEALGQLGTKEFSTNILPLLAHEDWDARAAAIKALGQLGDGEHSGSIVPLLADSSLPVRVSAANALVELGAVEHAHSIGPLLGDSHADVRRSAINALVKLGAKGHAVDIVPLLADSDVSVRGSAVRALAQLAAAEHAVDIAPLLEDNNEWVLRLAIDAIRSFGWIRPTPPEAPT